MLGYTPDLHVDLEYGRWVVWLENGSLSYRGLDSAIQESLVVAQVGELPELATPVDRFAIEHGADLAGRWRGTQRSVDIVTDGHGLALVHDGVRIPLQRYDRGGVSVMADHPDWELFPIDAVRALGEPGEMDAEPGAVVTLHHGGETFYRGGTEIEAAASYPSRA